MTEQEYFAALARNLHWGYTKDTTGVPGKWSELGEDERKVWRSLARRAARKIAELDALQQAESSSP
jgi:hypothetical protein